MRRVIAAVVIAGIAVLAWGRVGLLNLPSVPSDVTLESAGLANLEVMRELDELIRPAKSQESGVTPTIAGSTKAEYLGARRMQSAANDVRMGKVAAGLDEMRTVIRSQPNHLVFANVYRATIFGLQREFLHESRKHGDATPAFPSHLDKQPIAFFEELARTHPSRETKLHLAFAWVDHMLLFPALEIKAPSSVQAVDLLTGIIECGDAAYVPALFARGMNHLHRPARLVWPESAKTAKDAAVQDIGRCIAIGRKLGAGSHRLRLRLAMTLGDAYVKAGRNDSARSWWQVAQNMAGANDIDLQSAIRRRFGWRDEEIVDRLEEELDRARSELESPMTDLAMMWN